MVLGIGAVLEKGGATVIGAATGTETLFELIKQLKPDLLVLDIALYSTERFSFLRKLNEMHPEVPMVVLSVHREDAVAAAAIEAGARAYLLKTEAPTDLLNAVSAVRLGNVYRSENLEKKPGESRRDPETPIDLLTETELAVLKMVGKGYTLTKIAEESGRPIELVERDHWRLRTKLELQEPEDLLEFAAHWVHHEGGFS